MRARVVDTRYWSAWEAQSSFAARLEIGRAHV